MGAGLNCSAPVFLYPNQHHSKEMRVIDPFDGLLSDIPDGATEVPFQVVLTELHSPKLVEVVSTLLGWEKV